MKSNWRGQYYRYKSYMLNTVAQYKERQDVRTYLEILLSLATVSLFAIFALRPTLLTIAELLKDIESKKQTIETLDAKIEDLAQANSLYVSEKDSILLLEDAIPSEAAPDQLIRQLEGLVSRHPATILSISVEDAPLLGKATQSSPIDKNIDIYPDGANALTFSISATGSYTTLANLITDLENMRRPVKIDSLSFNKRPVQNGEEQLVLVIKSRVPYTYTP